MELPSDFIDALSAEFGKERAERILAGYRAPAPVSVRLNPLKTDSPEDLDLCAMGFSPVAHSSYGFFVRERPSFTLDPAFQAGCYYVQEASSMYIETVLHRLSSRNPLRVLDLCAAPGGKTTHWATLLRGFPGSLLVSNEVMGNRATVLCENVSKWGAANVVVTNNDPSTLGQLPDFFDIVAVDAPCSGEGMFRKDAGAIADWSRENVDFCASRQRRILSDVWPALRPGGLLVYSTCTLNRTEDEGNAEWIARELGAEMLEMRRFAPGDEGAGEGFFFALLRKKGGEGDCRTDRLPEVSGKPLRDRNRKFRGTDGKLSECSLSELGEPWKTAVGGDVRLFRKGNLIKAYPAAQLEDICLVESSLKVLMSGVALATVKEGGHSGRVLIPEHDFVQSELYRKGAFVEADLDRDTALRFMRRENIMLPGVPAGYVVITFRGIPLGLVKNLGSRVNNLWPASRRILS